MNLAIGCVAENTPKYLGQALRLVQSVRWFGGSLNDARLYVCVVDDISPDYRKELESYGASIRIVPRFSTEHPQSNKLRFLELPDLAQHDKILMLDCDTIVVGDPFPDLFSSDLTAKIADVPTVPLDTFRHLFAAFGLPMPEANQRCTVSGEATISYFNAGVLAFSRRAMGLLVPKWIELNQQLIARMELLGEHKNFCEQASLSLAVAATGIPFKVVGNAFNYPMHFRDPASAPRLADVTPFIVHYHWLSDHSGYILLSNYPSVNRCIDKFNARLRKEREFSFGRQNALVVLGMHRSGTSALTGVLSLLGIHAGESLLPATENVNPKGFWEHAEIVSIHDKMLKGLDSSWEDETPLPDGWWRSPLVADYRNKIISVLRHDFGNLSSWLIKDPRMCRLLPLWKEIFPALGCKPLFILALRNPAEVAHSLRKRNGLNEAESCLLWLTHMLEAEYQTRGQPRAFVTYERLLSDWRGALTDIGKTLCLAWPVTLEDAAPNVDAFLDPSLHHHRGNATLPDHPVCRMAQEGFELLSVPSPDPVKLDCLRERTDEVVKLVAPLSKQVRSLLSTVARLESEKAALQTEIMRIKNTASWKVTRPLRFVWNALSLALPRRAPRP